MFHRLKYYLVFGVIGVIAVVLVLNKFLVYGLVVFGVGALGVALWKVLLGAKDTEIYELKKKLAETSQNISSLTDENTELRSRKLNISEIKDVLDLGLMEVNANFTRVWNEESTHESRRIQFIGALQVSIIAKYGLDLKDLRVKFNKETNEIIVANIAPKFLSFNDLNYNWKIAEVLEYKLPMIGEEYWKKSDDMDGLNSEIRDKYQKHIHEEVKNGPEEMKWVLEPLKKQVAGALEILFDAKGRKIRIVEKFDESFKALQEFSEN
jgi:hypothetical protein